MTPTGHPAPQGLYDPRFEHDACGIGFVVDLHGRQSHSIVRDAVQILMNLEHRGACGCEKNTGDGAGITVQTPHRFLVKECDIVGIKLPREHGYGVAMVFLPTDDRDRAACEGMFEEAVKAEGQKVLGWRTVPTNNQPLGPTAKRGQPVIRQLFIGRDPNISDDQAFERKLYVVRRRAENAVRASDLAQKDMFYVPSLSHRTLIYKGMLVADQLNAFYPDLLDEDLESALALVHSRFSTNTFPSWPRAHPYRYICHNGEINTLRGNVNWMKARQGLFRSDLFGGDVAKILPIIDETGSDSAMFDNALELLVLGGRSLPHAVMMMIPEPWGGDPHMTADKKAFYEYHACLMEPWDGPASIAFTDGLRIGAVLDRNGLRPSRYYVTKDGRVILASEVGVLDVAPANVEYKGRLQPGRMLLIDLEEGRIVGDDELKHKFAREKPYARWLEDNLITLDELPAVPPPHEPDHQTVLQRQQAFGYTTEDMRILLSPMAADGNEALGSMGNDAALAVLSDKPQLLYNYFKQLFAQVTNPPVDCIREEVIMSMESTIGPEGNLLDPRPESARQIKIKSPILKNDELDKLRQLEGTSGGKFKSVTLQTLFRIDGGAAGMERALSALCKQASTAIATGHEFIS